MLRQAQDNQDAAPSVPVIPGWGPSYGAVQEIEWQIVDEGRYVLVLTSAAKNARNKTNVNGALGAVSHHIRRKAHCKLEEGSDNENDRCLRTSVQDGLQCRQPVGVIIRVPQALFKGQDALFSSAMSAGAERVQTSTEAWRCRTDSRVQEALATLTGIPIVLHCFVISIIAFLLATFLPRVAANIEQVENGVQFPEPCGHDGAGHDGNHNAEGDLLGENGWKTRAAKGISPKNKGKLKEVFQNMKVREIKQMLRTKGVYV